VGKLFNMGTTWGGISRDQVSRARFAAHEVLPDKALRYVALR
jgi:hypothetical protein